MSIFGNHSFDNCILYNYRMIAIELHMNLSHRYGCGQNRKVYEYVDQHTNFEMYLDHAYVIAIVQLSMYD